MIAVWTTAARHEPSAKLVNLAAPNRNRPAGMATLRRAWALVLLVLLVVVGCGGAVEPDPAPPTITWSSERGLEVTVRREIPAGAELEIGQTIEDPTAVILDWVSIDGTEVFAETTDGRADGFVIMTLPAPRELDLGTVITHRLERLDRTGLVEPLSAWFSVDGVELARYEADDDG